MLFRLAIAALLALSLPAAAAELPPGATVLDPDILWDVANPDAFALSPDGKQIAYISRGGIWRCDVTAGPPVKLADVPNSVTDILAQPGYESKRQQAASMSSTPGYRPFTGPIHLDERYIISLAWTPQQEGVVFIVWERIRENSPVVANRVMFASTAGVVSELANIEGQFGPPREHGFSFYVTRDRRHVIVSSYNATLIWQVSARRPRASCYEYLIPSPTSGNFLGVEIDTRQLVLVDQNFDITKRFEVVFKSDRRLRLAWSADERFAVCGEYGEYDAREWEGFRFDLDSGARGRLFAGYEPDRFLFRDDGEIVRLAIDPPRIGGYGDGSDGASIAVAAVGADERIVHRFSGLSRAPNVYRDRRGYPPVIATAAGTSFVMAVPRPNDERAGVHYHLVTDAGYLTPLTSNDDEAYNTPYYPLTFADQDRVLVARSGSTLFSIPVSRLTASTENADD